MEAREVGQQEDIAVDEDRRTDGLEDQREDVPGPPRREDHRTQVLNLERGPAKGGRTVGKETGSLESRLGLDSESGDRSIRRSWR